MEVFPTDLSNMFLNLCYYLSSQLPWKQISDHNLLCKEVFWIYLCFPLIFLLSAIFLPGLQDLANKVLHSVHLFTIFQTSQSCFLRILLLKWSLILLSLSWQGLWSAILPELSLPYTSSTLSCLSYIWRFPHFSVYLAWILNRTYAFFYFPEQGVFSPLQNYASTGKFASRMVQIRRMTEKRAKE